MSSQPNLNLKSSGLFLFVVNLVILVLFLYNVSQKRVEECQVCQSKIAMARILTAFPEKMTEAHALWLNNPCPRCNTVDNIVPVPQPEVEPEVNEEPIEEPVEQDIQPVSAYEGDGAAAEVTIPTTESNEDTKSNKTRRRFYSRSRLSRSE